MRQITLKATNSAHAHLTLKLADDALRPMMAMIGLEVPIPTSSGDMRHYINQLRVMDMPDIGTIEKLRTVYEWLGKYSNQTIIDFHTGFAQSCTTF